MDGVVETEKQTVPQHNCHRRRLTLVVVRHSERIDYAHRAVGRNWCKSNPEQPWNPPLTEKGLGMAAQLGSALSKDILPTLGLPPITAVYTSPFLRCRQTAAAILQGISSGHRAHKTHDSGQDEQTLSPSLRVKVEMGLAESICENWYRSWSLPGTDGTWGFKRQEIPHIDPVRHRMDPRVLKPVETLLDWKQSRDSTIFQKTLLDDMMDHEHRSLTTLGRDYSFNGNPPQLETGPLQRNRISRVIDALSKKHCDHAAIAPNKFIDGEKGETILLVSHGGIVTQFYVNLTGNNSKKHGIGKYCCFSIYSNENVTSSEDTEKADDSGQEKWIPLVVNQVLWNDVNKGDLD